ncbi:MAG: hypothetical protein IJZ30_05305 [Alphaproteobacteria bacterium]|nr:hypothetical protein [Alphaproteobacteria bacterium]
MSEENKRKLGEQLIRCVLDDKLSNDKKLRKMDYIIKMGADVNVRHEFGYSALGLAKAMKNEEIISFLEGKGAEDIGFDSKKAEEFFKRASIEEINNVLKILPDGFVLDCDVNLSRRGLKELPDFSRVVVNGQFACQYNELETLKGAPSVVGGDFNCYDNRLTTLIGAPREVGDNFDCSHNKLTTLKGAPSKVEGFFDCNDNQLTTLEGAPREVGASFNCSYNRLISLVGIPKEIGNNFICRDNVGLSIDAKPEKIGGKSYGIDIFPISKFNIGNDR